jgi:hypothetical protein
MNLIREAFPSTVYDPVGDTQLQVEVAPMSRAVLYGSVEYSPCFVVGDLEDSTKTKETLYAGIQLSPT